MHTHYDFDLWAGVCRVPRVAPKSAVRLTPALARTSVAGTTADRQGWLLLDLGFSIDTIAAVLHEEPIRLDASPSAVAPEACCEHQLADVLTGAERLVAFVRISAAVVVADLPIRLP